MSLISFSLIKGNEKSIPGMLTLLLVFNKCEFKDLTTILFFITSLTSVTNFPSSNKILTPGYTSLSISYETVILFSSPIKFLCDLASV